MQLVSEFQVQIFLLRLKMWVYIVYKLQPKTISVLTFIYNTFTLYYLKEE